MAWHKTDWRFVTSRGAEITGGEWINVGATIGSLYVKNVISNDELQLNYTAKGVGVGIGPPLNIDGWGPRIPGESATTHIWARDRRSLAPTDFGGWCYLLNAQATKRYFPIHGSSVCSVLFGVPSPLAFGFIGGPTIGIQAGGGIMIYFGRITL